MSRAPFLPRGAFVRDYSDTVPVAGWPTTRRHPRSLADAFPAERAPALEIPPRRDRVLGRVLAVAIGAVMSWAAIVWVWGAAP